ncbi:hypothetical protein Tcan_16320 [Toxocara canis]|uniref:Sulfur globule protein CV3 domain protein n=1 Tax=Toxocara canis TaxID=6265 RepID=A0A0B2VW44_TOXCA|nr:hypothetical protein Tcan_16320 [Toxocara canis]
MRRYLSTAILLSLLLLFENIVAENNEWSEPAGNAIRSRGRRWIAFGWGWPYGGFGWPYGGYGGPWGYGGYGFGWPYGFYGR